ncbi:MAG TPA: hypothetical protein DIW43_01890 [Spongiibacteraceae bacterium]|nr:hypothetical protein [Spongiibacteraceae bacterium]HCS26174.1 hypothetical protein [Spongiibacteraceae bacterium]
MRQYLARYAEPEITMLGPLAGQLPGRWQQALVIPAYKESPAFLDQAMPANALLILVLNRPPDDTNNDWAQAIIQSLPAPNWQCVHLSLHQRADNADVLVADRCIKGAPIPAKQGVGLARKIGADIACQLLSTGHLRSPWLACTDADARLPDDYWHALHRQTDPASACVFPFSHRRRPPTADAIARYELHMLYYVAGLRFAGSPYAWPTIGSCIAFDADAYTQVRGYPKKAGGEDFYLLNKLAKLTGVRHLSGPQVSLSARVSDRVPFGTGPALSNIQKLEAPDKFCSYHPQSFAYLKAALEGLLLSAQDELAPSPRRIATRHNLNSEWFSRLWSDFACDDAITQARSNSRSEAQMQRRLMTWFDGFRTLKWIHACRTWLPDQALSNCIEKANWLTVSRHFSASLDQQVAMLHGQLADNALRGPAITRTNEATAPESVNISGQ